jgi:hypothetical protein
VRVVHAAVTVLVGEAASVVVTVLVVLVVAMADGGTGQGAGGVPCGWRRTRAATAVGPLRAVGRECAGRALDAAPRRT